MAVRKDSPKDSQQELDQLISDLAATVRYKETRRLGRRLDGGNAAALVFVLLCGGAASYFAFHTDTWWSWLIGGGIAFFALLLAWAGSLQLYSYPDIEPPAVLAERSKE